jgi:hypothetical protein
MLPEVGAPVELLEAMSVPLTTMPSYADSAPAVTVATDVVAKVGWSTWTSRTSLADPAGDMVVDKKLLPVNDSAQL